MNYLDLNNIIPGKNRGEVTLGELFAFRDKLDNRPERLQRENKQSLKWHQVMAETFVEEGGFVAEINMIYHSKGLKVDKSKGILKSVLAETCDGAHRVDAGFGLVDNKFTFSPNQKATLKSGREIHIGDQTFSEIPDELQERILNFPLGIMFHIDPSPEKVAKLFSEILNNSNTPVKPQESRNTRPTTLAGSIRDIGRHNIYNLTAFDKVSKFNKKLGRYEEKYQNIAMKSKDQEGEQFVAIACKFIEAGDFGITIDKDNLDDLYKNPLYDHTFPFTNKVKKLLSKWNVYVTSIDNKSFWSELHSVFLLRIFDRLERDGITIDYPILFTRKFIGRVSKLSIFTEEHKALGLRTSPFKDRLKQKTTDDVTNSINSFLRDTISTDENGKLIDAFDVFKSWGLSTRDKRRDYTDAEIEAKKEEQNHMCPCDEPIEDGQEYVGGHINAYALGNPTTYENLVVEHKTCNLKHGIMPVKVTKAA